MNIGVTGKGSTLTGSKKAQCERERQFVAERRRGFDLLTSRAWKMLTKKFGPKIAKEEIQTVCRVLSNELNIPLAREYIRRKELMIVWLEENYDVVSTFIEKNMILEDVNGKVISN